MQTYRHFIIIYISSSPSSSIITIITTTRSVEFPARRKKFSTSGESSQKQTRDPWASHRWVKIIILPLLESCLSRFFCFQEHLLAGITKSITALDFDWNSRRRRATGPSRKMINTLLKKHICGRYTLRKKHRKNYECCPVSQLIVR